MTKKVRNGKIKRRKEKEISEGRKEGRRINEQTNKVNRQEEKKNKEMK